MDNDNTKKDDLIPISEAAELLEVSIMTLRRWDESGRLKPVRSGKGGHRYYRKKDIEVFMNDLLKLAKDWVVSNAEFPEGYYCQNSAIFLARITRMETLMMQNKETKDSFPLIVSVAGEIGNNSYDHNIGQWIDTPGIFFGYDLNKRQIVLADRGVGILQTLKRVKPELKNHKEALQVAFTEVISGRTPEARGNGLKYVRNVISKNQMSLMFQTGDAILTMQGNNREIHIETAPENIRGCLVLINY
jgi:excisionase family DNA binding protein